DVPRVVCPLAGRGVGKAAQTAQVTCCPTTGGLAERPWFPTTTPRKKCVKCGKCPGGGDSLHFTHFLRGGAPSCLRTSRTGKVGGTVPVSARRRPRGCPGPSGGRAGRKTPGYSGRARRGRPPRPGCPARSSGP